MLPPKLHETLTIRFRRGPIDSVKSLADFVQTRASYVAQTSLYGYVKNRMGIKYPEMFEDEVMARSINQAKWRTYGSCLADLAVFAAATVGLDGRLPETRIAELAGHCFDHALAESFDDEDAGQLRPEIIDRFSARLAKTDWASAADGENAFLDSPADLLRFAPIADHLKELDADIVVNSTRFRWRDIRSQLRDRVDAAAISREWMET